MIEFSYETYFGLNISCINDLKITDQIIRVELGNTI